MLVVFVYLSGLMFLVEILVCVRYVWFESSLDKIFCKVFENLYPLNQLPTKIIKMGILIDGHNDIIFYLFCFNEGSSFNILLS